jgi:hypothetical protein
MMRFFIFLYYYTDTIETEWVCLGLKRVVNMRRRRVSI